MTEEQVRQIEALIAERKQVLFTGMEQLYALKVIIERAVNEAGIVIEWDPSTPPALRERLTIISLSALQWGLGVAALGMFIGAFTDKPGTWTAAGAGLGALIGGIKGHGAIRSGWRLRGGRDENGVEYVEVIVRALPEALAAGPTGQQQQQQQQRRGDPYPWWQGSRPEDPR